MANPAEFKDYSVEVMAALNETTIAWLHETANEVTSHAQRNCVMEDDAGKRLKGSYKNEVDESKGVATIGTPLEEGYWEEFGTGSHADVRKNGGKRGRQGWWVYVKGQRSGEKSSAEYRDEDEAKAVAASMKDEGLDAYATNGREPNYTLETAFKTNKNPAIAELKRRLKERMEK